MEVWLIIIVIITVGWVLQLWAKARKYNELRPRLQNLELREVDLMKKQQEWEQKVESDTKAINILAKEKSQGFPWLAQAYADFFHLQDLEAARSLEHKSHPARKAAEHVREVAGKRRVAERLWRALKYQLQYYETLFPWLVDFKEEDLDDLIMQLVERTTRAEPEIDEEEDPARHWLTQAEFENLSTTEKYQRALDRYWQKKKTKWEVGRDYERYIGYIYERDGWQVYYQGILKGLEDLGRDLIAKKDNYTQIVQCKYWSRRNPIHEKHILQLFGTTVAYIIDHPGPSVSGRLITSTVLSEKAMEFAKKLNVTYAMEYPLMPYASVKCNVSRRDGSKIYHLPFDQQYDRTLIEEERMERYVETVREAEELGFRRAFRWSGKSSE